MYVSILCVQVCMYAGMLVKSPVHREDVSLHAHK